MAIMRYNTDQTGPKTQPGGVHEGLIRSAYQAGMDGVVKIDPNHPAPKQMAIHTIRPMSERDRLMSNPMAIEEEGLRADHLGSVGYPASTHSLQPPLRA